MVDKTPTSTADIHDKLRDDRLPPLGHNRRGIPVDDTRIRPGDIIEKVGLDRTYYLVIDCDEFDIICYLPETNTYTNYPREMVETDLSMEDVFHHSKVIT